MSKTPQFDKALGEILDNLQPHSKTCKQCSVNFDIFIEDIEMYKKLQVPAPTFCPECRLIRRMTFKNERTFYKRKCDLCDKLIIAVYPQNTSFPVYCPSCWLSDKWNALDYGRDYDFSKPFFEQFRELLNKIPRISLLIDYLRSINSEYTNYTGPLKNCYLVIQAEDNENCSYSSIIVGSQDSMDCYRVFNTQKSYELFNCENCYKCSFSMNCLDCIDVYFSKNLKNCQNCFSCTNLRHKNYHIFNKPYSKEEYSKFIENLNFKSFKIIREYKKKSEDFWLNSINKPNTNGLLNLNVSGDYISNSKNIFYSFDIVGGENLKYCFQAHMPISKDCYDYGDWGNNASLMYESINCGENISNTKFSFGSWIGDYLQYCDTVVSSDYMFGCSMVRKGKYCILNKQYTKESFDKLRTQIIEHMNSMPYVDKKGRIYKYGEFFPPELSPFAYNETIAQEYFPLTKEQAIEQGYSWKDPEERNIPITIKSDQLPDHIKDVKDDILNQVIQCANNSDAQRGRSPDQDASGCTTAFKIIPQELEFYRKMNLPLPRLCPNCRHYQRIKQRNPFKLWKRKCQCNGTKSDNGVYQNTITHTHGTEPCRNEFETTYAPERKEIVYCEKCYQAEVA